MSVFLTRISHFCMAHACRRSELSDEENFAIFGKESYLHGHNFRLDVTVRGPINSSTGMVINLIDLDAVIKSTVVNQLDHRRLDTDIPWFRDNTPTIENILVFIWRRLQPLLSECELVRLRLFQDERTYYDYFGGMDARETAGAG